MSQATLHLGDCLDILPTLEANSIDSIVCDPPYGLSFMGKNWDHGVPGVAFWEAALRVAKPGAHLLAFGGARTHHRLMVAIEDAGWEIRDCLMWLYASGFPKSHNISKAIDKAAGAERESIWYDRYKDGGARARQEVGRSHVGFSPQHAANGNFTTLPATDAARQWDGWGTALKPAWEPIIMARKPLVGTVAENVLKWGTGGLAIDKCRIGTDKIVTHGGGRASTENWRLTQEIGTAHTGRWPANVLLDEEAAALLDQQSGERKSGGHKLGSRQGRGINGIYGDYDGFPGQAYEANSGGASRFFFVAKASKRDRDEGLEGMPEGNHHPTVKPTQLCRYLVRLVTPPNGTVLDPFMGSGSTGKGARLEGFGFVGIELDADYFAIAERRIAEAQQQLPLLDLAVE